MHTDTSPTARGAGSSTDIVAAALRTRYYHARLLIHLPYLYTALHSTKELSDSEAERCRIAIQSACNWPLASPPSCNTKRLVPHLFAWTQNFTGILLILRMTQQNQALRASCAGSIPQQHIEHAAQRLLDWIEDMKQIDAIAEWSWRLVQPLFS